MGLIKPDFSEVQDKVEPGEYKLRVDSFKETSYTSQKTQQEVPVLNWRLVTFGESDPKNEGRSVFHRTPVAGGGAFKLKDLYKACTGEELEGEFDTDQLIGKEVGAVVIENDRGYTEIKSLRALQ